MNGFPSPSDITYTSFDLTTAKIPVQLGDSFMIRLRVPITSTEISLDCTALWSHPGTFSAHDLKADTTSTPPRGEGWPPPRGMVCRIFVADSLPEKPLANGAIAGKPIIDNKWDRKPSAPVPATASARLKPLDIRTSTGRIEGHYLIEMFIFNSGSVSRTLSFHPGSITIRSADGGKVSIIDPLLAVLPLRSIAGSVTIAPNEGVIRTMQLGRDFDNLPPGKYVVSIIYSREVQESPLEVEVEISGKP